MLSQSIGDGRYTTATSWKRFGNQQPRTIQGRTPETFYNIECTRWTKRAKNRQSTNRCPTLLRRAEYKRQHRQLLLLETQLKVQNSASIQSSSLSQFSCWKFKFSNFDIRCPTKLSIQSKNLKFNDSISNINMNLDISSCLCQ